MKFFKYNNIKFDYFYKWNSSCLDLSDLILKLFFDNMNKKKFLVEPLVSIDYMIFDTIFLNYNIYEKKRFFYLYKAKYFLNFFFKLSKKEKLKLKCLDYLYLYNYYFLLNKNYNFIYYSFY